MKYLAITIFTLINTASVFAQVGRVDITLDTVPLGGDEQRDKMQRMKAHDELKNDLIVLRDSIKRYATEIDRTTSDKNTSHAYINEKKTVTEHITQLDNLIDQFNKTQADVSLNRKAYTVLSAVRRDFNGIRSKTK